MLAVCVALFLVWQTVSSLLIVFAGVLLAAFLDAAARAIAPVLRLNRVLRLTLVLLLLTAMTGFGLVWGAGKLPEQTRLLLKVMDTQLDVLRGHLVAYGVDLLGPEWGRDLTQWLFSDQGRFFSHAQRVLGGASTVLTGMLVIVFLGILFAFDPTSHRESLVILAKQSYARADAGGDERDGERAAALVRRTTDPHHPDDAVRVGGALSDRASWSLRAGSAGKPLELHSLSLDRFLRQSQSRLWQCRWAVHC